MKKINFNYSKLISLLLVVSMLLSFVPTNFVRAEENYPAYEMVDVGGTQQLEFHNSIVDIPVDEAITLLGIDDISEALLRIKDGETVVWTTADVDIGSGSISNNLTMEANKTYVIETGELKMPSWKPSTWYTEWTAKSSFVTKIYDVLTVNSNQPDVVFVDGTPVQSKLNVKVYRGTSATIDVTMGSLLNNTVSMTVDGEKVLTDVGSYDIQSMTKDTKVDVVYVEDTESAIELAPAASANADYSFVPTAQPGTEVSVVVSPKPGYHVTKLAIMNGEDVVDADVAYANGVATVKFTTGEHKALYKIECETAATLVLGGNLIVPYNDQMSNDEIVAAILACIDSENSAPIFPDKTDMLIEYNAANINADTAPQWKSIDFVPGTLEQLAVHQFGHKDTMEKIRITYTGDGEKYGAGVATFIVSLVDDRKETAAIDSADSVTVTYGEFTKESVLNAFLDGKMGVFDSETGAAIDGAAVVLTTDPAKLFAGEHNLTLKFVGNAEYKECSKTVKLVVKQAPVDLTVSSQTLSPNSGKTLKDVVSISNSKVNYVSAAIALDAVEGTAIAYVDISGFLDANPTLKSIVDSVLGDVSSKELTLEEFTNLVQLMNGIDSAVDTTYLNKFVDLLKQVQELDGVGDVKLNVTIKGDIKFNNSGLYLIGAMVTDVNYVMDMDMGYVVVVPETIKADLSFNEEIAKIISVDGIKENVYDFGVTAKVDGKEDTNAMNRLHNVFFGVTAAGDVYVENTMTDAVGAYTQIAYIQDLGNVIYYAKPIARLLVVTPEEVDVVFVDKDGNEITDWDFVYDGTQKDISVNVISKQRAAIDMENLTVKFVGLTAAGKVYNSDVAPTDAGAYTVSAVYADQANEVVGTNMKAFIIKKADSGFSAADKNVVFDGNGHNINVINPNNMYLATLIIEAEDKLNLIVPERLFEGTVAFTKDDVVKVIKDYINENDIKILIDADTLAQLKDYINNIENYQITINGAEPSEIGEYEVFALAIAKNYQTTIDKAVLTIECDHSNLGDWEHDDDKHWKTCECGVKCEEGDHVYEDRKCVCGMEEPGDPECKHENVGDWKSDDNKHWKECECGAKVSEGEHEYVDGKCECGKEEPKTPVEPECDHADAEWKHDDEKHWKECECGNKSDEGAHSYTEGKCVCGKTEPQAPVEPECKHETLSGWKHNAEKHWKECECGAKVEEAAHEYENGKCKVCGVDKPVDPDPDDTETPKLGYEGFNPTILFLLMAFSAVGLATGTIMYVHPFKKKGGKYLKKD